MLWAVWVTFRYYRDETITGWGHLFGAARHQGEIDDFRTYLIVVDAIANV